MYFCTIYRPWWPLLLLTTETIFSNLMSRLMPRPLDEDPGLMIQMFMKPSTIDSGLNLRMTSRVLLHCVYKWFDGKLSSEGGVWKKKKRKKNHCSNYYLDFLITVCKLEAVLTFDFSLRKKKWLFWYSIVEFVDFYIPGLCLLLLKLSTLSTCLSNRWGGTLAYLFILRPFSRQKDLIILHSAWIPQKQLIFPIMIFFTTLHGHFGYP